MPEYKRIPRAREGDHAIFYRDGDVRNGSECCHITAVVNGRPTLFFHTSSDYRQNIPHATDRCLDDTEQRRMNGCWDSVENHDARAQKREKDARELVRRREKEREEREKAEIAERKKHQRRVLQLFKNGLDAMEIADKMEEETGIPWSFETVTPILDKAGVIVVN